MAGHLYGYTTQSSASAAAAAAAASSRALTEPYYPSSLYLSQATTDAYSRTASHLASLASWSSAVAAATVDDASVSGIKRSAEALYPSTVLGSHSMAGHDAWYSSDALAKRLRYENSSNLPLYPQRPGEKDCAHYMLTRTCKFGESCRFDHPHWVPEGGIPEWKEVPPVGNDLLPERPGELDCPYFLKTQRCKFGVRCRFNHPKGASENDGSLPDRPAETPCAFYLKTGMCKFGATCKFHHPKDIQLPLVGHDSTSNPYEVAQNEGISVTPAVLYNSKELPVRPGEADCPFYLKTGSCKYGITCRYSHPDRNIIIPQAAGLGHALAVSPAAALSLGVVNPVASLYQTIDPRLAQATVGIASSYPQRPGQLECDFYMKTGICKFGERCKYHHPYDRSAPTSAAVQAQLNIKLTLAGLPRREGSIICPYYLKTGTCKFGATCKFDHPPPGEVMAMGSTAQEATGNGEKEEEGSESESD